MDNKLTELDNKALPPALTEWAEDNKIRSGVFCSQYRGRTVYLIAGGEKPTGGFRISVLPFCHGDNRVIYRVEGPAEEDFVIQIITYPYLLLSAEDRGELQFFREENGILHPVPVEMLPPL